MRFKGEGVGGRVERAMRGRRGGGGGGGDGGRRRRLGRLRVGRRILVGQLW